MLTLERLKQMLRYEPSTGDFVWLVSPRRSVPAMSLAGTVTAKGYRTITIDRVNHKAHRLAWFYMTGEWPPADTDHINGVRHDNRFLNLRPASRELNQQNRRKANAQNKTGVLGVSRYRGGFRARIVHRRKLYHLGKYATLEAAQEAYLQEKRRIHQGNTL